MTSTKYCIWHFVCKKRALTKFVFNCNYSRKDIVALSLNAAFAKADNYISKKEFAAAEKVLKSILSAHPTNKKAKRDIKKIQMSLSNSQPVVLEPNPDIRKSILFLYNNGQTEEVLEKIEGLLPHFPESTFLWNVRGASYRQIGNLDKAEDAYRKAIKSSPNFIDALNNLGAVLKEKGDLLGAKEVLNRAIGKDPKFPEALNNLGNVLSDLGDYKAAETAYEKALELKPDYPEAHRNISQFKTYLPHEKTFRLLKELVSKTCYSRYAKCNFSFALAKYCEDAGNFYEAFNFYKQANMLRKQDLGYNFFQDELLFKEIKKSVSFSKNIALEIKSEIKIPTPIFILGMPRSGTTLAEQIISCHPEVYAAGELAVVQNHAAQILSEPKQNWFDNLMIFRQSYIDKAMSLSRGHKFITDKMPHNFRFINLIKSALPESKIVHVHRCAEATCWSNFKHYFSMNGLGYSYDLEDTFRYYKLYNELMLTWDDLYRGQIYHLDYEKLVLNQEQETRSLISFLGLEWNSLFLFPNENGRPIGTASHMQARSKIYKNSSSDWKKYEPFMMGALQNLDSFGDFKRNYS